MDTVSSYFRLYVQENRVPVFTNLPNSATVDYVADKENTVFTVSATDADNDEVTFSMVCRVSECPFDIDSESK